MAYKCVLYFVKYPEPGKVKTRLAKSIGNEAAALAYRGLAESGFSTLKELSPSEFKITVMFDPPEKEREVREWLAGASDYKPQNGNDLGERLTHAFKSAFGEDACAVAALGSDTLGLKKEMIEKAFDNLQYYDAVIGPAKDGGYYLIGCKEIYESLFENIPWSTPGVLKATLGWIREEGLSHSLLPELEDLDELKISDKKR